MNSQLSVHSSIRRGGDAFAVSAGDSDPDSGAGNQTWPHEESLVIILDLTPACWVNGVAPVSPATSESRLQLYNLYNILYRFLKVYAFMSSDNRCCIIGTHASGSKILYEGLISNDWLESSFCGDGSRNKHVDSTVVGIWHAILDFIVSGAHSAGGDPQLTSAISMGLLYLNRLKQTGAGFGRRILLFDVSKVDGYKSQYIGLMNAAFTATKSNISINTCAFGESSRILEQLSDITNAKYLSMRKVLKSEGDLIPYDQSISQLLTAASEHLSTQLPFDFSNTAVCYCHYRTVDIAFICPCCFAVYCSERDDNEKYRVFCFVCNSRLTKQLVKLKTAGDADLSRT